MVSADPLEERSLPLERLGPSRFWCGIDASLVDKWSTGSRPSLFLILEGRLHPVGLALLQLRYRVRLEVRCEAGHSARLLQLHKPGRTEFSQSTGWVWSLTPKAPMGAHRPKLLPRA